MRLLSKKKAEPSESLPPFKTPVKVAKLTSSLKKEPRKKVQSPLVSLPKRSVTFNENSDFTNLLVVKQLSVIEEDTVIVESENDVTSITPPLANKEINALEQLVPKVETELTPEAEIVTEPTSNPVIEIRRSHSMTFNPLSMASAAARSQTFRN